MAQLVQITKPKLNSIKMLIDNFDFLDKITMKENGILAGNSDQIYDGLIISNVCS